MKIRTSYFFKLRDFKPWMIPISTAMWDPKWYHDFKGPDHVFKDKRGVYNGLRYESIVPGITCNGLCHGSPCPEEPGTCMFLQNYYKQLEALDFDTVMRDFENLANAIKSHEGFTEAPEIVIMVYEKPEQACSERVMLHKWFKAHGCDIEEVE